MHRNNKKEHRTNYKDGEWVYGLIAKLYDERFPNLPAEMSNEDGITGIEIDYKTIGQYTGLTDKNGRKIFEGDIVKIKGKVRYIFYGISSFRHTNYGEYAAELGDVFTDKYCEVIGNKIDNSELLR